jgi:hypothetical protein
MDGVDVDQLIEALIEREGGYVSHPADKGGPTCFGITEAVARAHGYAGPMRQLPREEAAVIYRRLYWLRPHFDEIAKRSGRVAAEMFDTGANMGPAVAATFLQRALTALNRNGSDYPDLVPDGRAGPVTLAALDGFLAVRGKASGETVLLRALEALQGERYLRLAERRPGNYILDLASTHCLEGTGKGNEHEREHHRPNLPRRRQSPRAHPRVALGRWCRLSSLWQRQSHPHGWQDASRLLAMQ